MVFLPWRLHQKPPHIVIQNAMHPNRPHSTTMVAVVKSEGKICSWSLEPQSIPQCNVDYAQWTCYLDILKPHGQLSGTKMQGWSLPDGVPWPLDQTW